MGTLRFRYVWAMLLAGPLYGAPVYSIVNLGSLSGATSEAFVIGAGGTAAGSAGRAITGVDLPVLYDGVQVRVLSESAGQVNGLNDSGTAVGTTYTPTGARATVWTNNGEQFLPTLGGDQSYGLAINSGGNVAGSSLTASGSAHAFLTLADSILDLGTLGGGWSSAYGVNDRLDVVGYSMTSSGRFGAFYWTQDSGMLEIPTFGGANSYAFGINERGSVVGAANTRSGYTHAFLYESGATRSLGTLGGRSSFAYGINAANHVVGYSYDRLGRSRGFVWIDGIMYDLQSLAAGLDGWTLDRAYGINDQGQIAGSGTYQGQAAAFRLDPVAVQPSLRQASAMSADLIVGNDGFAPAPVPEPTSGVLVLLCIALMGFYHRKGPA